MSKRKQRKLTIQPLEARQLMAGDWYAGWNALKAQPQVVEQSAEVKVISERVYDECDMWGCTYKNADKLQITGTDLNDTIRVNQYNKVQRKYNSQTGRFETVTEPRILVQIENAAGTQVKEFNPKRYDFVEIVIDAKKGDDTVRQSVNIPTVAHGGEGDDRIYGGPANDRIYGNKPMRRRISQPSS